MEMWMVCFIVSDVIIYSHSLSEPGVSWRVTRIFVAYIFVVERHIDEQSPDEDERVARRFLKSTTASRNRGMSPGEQYRRVYF
jgi:hypothetical protein